MVCQAQVVIAGQVYDFFPVVAAHRGLLVVEDPEVEVSPLGLEFFEDGGKISELRARGSSL
jgi:hypothetical protein